MIVLSGAAVHANVRRSCSSAPSEAMQSMRPAPNDNIHADFRVGSSSKSIFDYTRDLRSPFDDIVGVNLNIQGQFPRALNDAQAPTGKHLW